MFIWDDLQQQQQQHKSIMIDLYDVEQILL